LLTKAQAFADVFEAFHKHEIEYCVLRDDLEEHGGDNELDVLVNRDKRCQLVSGLACLGFQIKVREKFIPHKLAFIRFRNGSFQVIDLHLEIVQDALVYMDAASVLARRKAIRNYFLPADPDFYVILVVHNLLGKGFIQPKHSKTLLALSDNIEPSEVYRAVEAIPDLGPILIRIMADPLAFTSSTADTKCFQNNIAKILARSDPQSRYFRIRRLIARALRRFSLRTKAPLYVVLGVDGVGKSSICDSLERIFNEHGAMRATQYYMGPWGHYQLTFMRGELFVPGWSISFSQWWSSVVVRNESNSFTLGDVFRVVRMNRSGQQLRDQDKILREKIRSHSKIYVTARYLRSTWAAWRFLAALMLEMGYRYFKIYKLRRRGTIVIGDRYIYDLLTGRMHEEIPNYVRTRRFLCRIFFKPTRVFLLTNDADVIFQRKQDLSLNELEKFERIYARLASDYGFELIKTDAPADWLAANIIERYFDEIIHYVRF